MAIQPQQTQLKRKRSLEGVWTLMRRSLYCADGAVHLKSCREADQTDPTNTFNRSRISIPALCVLEDVSNKLQRTLVRSNRPQYLRDASSLEEFKSVFTQAVRCHRVIYVKTGSLHGNLSPHRIMFTRDGDGASMGCLEDRDSAKLVFTGETWTTPAAGRRAGETPFMAIELLREEPPPHLYRHDLESFLYILIWCAVHFNLDDSEEPPINKALENWTHDTWDIVRRAKGELFSTDSAKCRLSILRGITPTFRPMQRWIVGLIRMFDAGHQARKRHDDSLAFMQWGEDQEDFEAWDEETAGGHITYETFMAAISESPQLEL